MSALVDLTGQTFGRLTVLKRAYANTPGREAHWTCSCVCGGEKTARGNNLRRGATRSCGCLSREVRAARYTGPSNPHWRGGRSDSHGYVEVRVAEGHWLAAMRSKKGYIPEHRLVVAESLGRPLNSNEVVHHINGVKTDNRLENLRLCGSNAEHAALDVERRAAEREELIRLRAENVELRRRLEGESA